MMATTNGSVKIEFMPFVGSVVEFLSDRQTEKGPSAGTVISCNWKNNTCVIRHSEVCEKKSQRQTAPRLLGTSLRIMKIRILRDQTNLGRSGYSGYKFRLFRLFGHTYLMIEYDYDRRNDGL
jgi:hypothetical protein